MLNLFEIFRDLVRPPDIAIFHEFHRPPYGGGNQFLLALRKELRRRGISVGVHTGQQTKAALINSFNFDSEKVKRVKQRYPHMRIVHRLAGPIGVYRGTDIEIDRQTQQLNAELADATIFQSQYSADKYHELGLVFKNPTVIRNTVDSDIFHARGRVAPPAGKRKFRLIATAWSDNPKKGSALLSWLDEHLDHTRFELTFVGRTKAPFKNTRVLGPVSSEKLAEILREHDVYIAASQDDPCSNALIEALACGLPAAYLRSGGHPELVGNGGVGFTHEQEALTAIEAVATDWHRYHTAIHIPTISETAQKYLQILHVANH